MFVNAPSRGAPRVPRNFAHLLGGDFRSERQRRRRYDNRAFRRRRLGMADQPIARQNGGQPAEDEGYQKNNKVVAAHSYTNSAPILISEPSRLLSRCSLIGLISLWRRPRWWFRWLRVRRKGPKTGL